MTGEPKQLHKTLVKQHVGQALVFVYDTDAHKGVTVMIKAITTSSLILRTVQKCTSGD